jgi:CheY-like chemotaxis protein
MPDTRPPPRVLVVEDDTSVRRLVQLALEELPITLQLCADGDSALQALQHSPVQLLITDLMMPGLSGYELLERLVATPALRQGARLVAFSAGLDAEARERLQALGVWRLLAKPVSLQALEDCVRQAVLAADAAGVPAVAPAAVSPHSAADEAAAIAAHFGGNAALFHAFRASCLPQFVQDVQAADAALAGRDAAALRRQAHSLKSVLATLGQAGAAARAREMETTALQADWPAAQAAWAPLRAALLGLAGSGAPGV